MVGSDISELDGGGSGDDDDGTVDSVVLLGESLLVELSLDVPAPTSLDP